MDLSIGLNIDLKATPPMVLSRRSDGAGRRADALDLQKASLSHCRGGAAVPLSIEPITADGNSIGAMQASKARTKVDTSINIRCAQPVNVSSALDKRIGVHLASPPMTPVLLAFLKQGLAELFGT